MKNLLRWATGLSSALLLVLPVHAMTASQTVEVERQVKQSDGTVTTIVTAPDKVLPGDMLVYTVDYYNDKSDVTENFRLDMPIPTEITYLEGSADHDGATVLYSADNGATFQARENLTVNLEAGATRSALAADITQIRWTLTDNVSPGERGEIKFKGRLK